MSRRTLAWMLVALEVASLGAFLFANHQADRFMALSGRSGDAYLTSVWMGRSGIAFWLLALLWATAVTLTAVRSEGSGKLQANGLRGTVKGVFALATLLPLIGLGMAYLSNAS
jgi:S-formylglutathione hydrolase FrmB